MRRAAEVAGLFADAGLVAIVALISPYAPAATARRIHEQAGLPFVEVYMATSVDVCADRDPKGLYARAEAGEIGSFTGVDATTKTTLSTQDGSSVGNSTSTPSIKSTGALCRALH